MVSTPKCPIVNSSRFSSYTSCRLKIVRNSVVVNLREYVIEAIFGWLATLLVYVHTVHVHSTPYRYVYCANTTTSLFEKRAKISHHTLYTRIFLRSRDTVGENDGKHCSASHEHHANLALHAHITPIHPLNICCSRSSKTIFM
jgi:hypothetical protein